MEEDIELPIYLADKVLSAVHLSADSSFLSIYSYLLAVRTRGFS